MAELKKSKKANLDDKRWKGFLLGLTVACSIFFVAMEYTTRPPRADDDMEVDEDFLEALELKLKKDRDDMISVSSPKPPPPAVTEKVREAEMKSVVAEKIAPDGCLHAVAHPQLEIPACSSATAHRGKGHRILYHQ